MPKNLQNWPTTASNNAYFFNDVAKVGEKCLRFFTPSLTYWVAERFKIKYLNYWIFLGFTVEDRSALFDRNMTELNTRPIRK